MFSRKTLFPTRHTKPLHLLATGLCPQNDSEVLAGDDESTSFYVSCIPVGSCKTTCSSPSPLHELATTSALETSIPYFVPAALTTNETFSVPSTAPTMAAVNADCARSWLRLPPCDCRRKCHRRGSLSIKSTKLTPKHKLPWFCRRRRCGRPPRPDKVLFRLLPLNRFRQTAPAWKTPRSSCHTTDRTPGISLSCTMAARRLGHAQNHLSASDLATKCRRSSSGTRYMRHGKCFLGLLNNRKCSDPNDAHTLTTTCGLSLFSTSFTGHYHTSLQRPPDQQRPPPWPPPPAACSRTVIFLFYT